EEGGEGLDSGVPFWPEYPQSMRRIHPLWRGGRRRQLQCRARIFSSAAHRYPDVAQDGASVGAAGKDLWLKALELEDERPSDELMLRQLELEDQNIQEAVTRYEELVAEMLKMGKLTHLGRNKTMLLEWYWPLRDAVGKEQKAIW
ncbi:unnamed protein product, partial [Chrysoparadoxa australica]